MTPAAEAKREELLSFIQHVLEPEPSVQAVVGIGSIASGYARPGSDIDVAVFFDPMDWFVIPAEFIWRPVDGSYHSIFSEDDQVRQEGIELDCMRLDLREWSEPGFDWPEGSKAELSQGWIAFDRSGEFASLLEEKTSYPEIIRQERLDEAIIWLDQHLGEDRPQRCWESLGPLIAHDRLQAAYQNLVQALFAANRRWLPWRNRQMSSLLRLPWLPEGFGEVVMEAAHAPSLDVNGYSTRTAVLARLFEGVMNRLVEEGSYSTTPIDQAFIRAHDQPGYAWNMEEWRAENLGRFIHMVTEDE